MVGVPHVQPSKPETIEFPEHAQHIAMFGDWHGNLHFAKDAIANLPADVDVAIHTGDFGYMFNDDYLNSVNKAARRKDIVLMFVDGNHENHEWLNNQPIDDDGVRRLRPRVWHLPRGFRWEWFGLKFLALGGAHSVDRQSRIEGLSWWADEFVNHHEMEKAIAGGDADIMITHDAPDGHHIPGLAPANMFPQKELLSAAQHRYTVGTVVREVNARYLWHGHYHSRYITTNGGTIVTGLDCDNRGPDAFRRNVDIIDLGELQ